MKKITTLLALALFAPLFSGCANTGSMWEAANWFTEKTNGRNSSWTVSNAATSTADGGMHDASERVSIAHANSSLDDSRRNENWTVERAATKVSDGADHETKISFYGAHNAVKKAQGR